MGLVRNVSPFHLRRSHFCLGVCLWFLGFFVWCWFVFVFCLLLPSRVRSLSCVRIVCNLERPSELSWRARHGRKKKQLLQLGLANNLASLAMLQILDLFFHSIKSLLCVQCHE